MLVVEKKEERNRARCESKRDARTFMPTNMKFHRGYITIRAFNQTTCVRFNVGATRRISRSETGATTALANEADKLFYIR